METTNITFWDLINESKINIPIIQRDYAQGRKGEKERRDKFLDAIFEHLRDGLPLHLDFVYGKFQLDASTTTLFPIDGQQRLTTLFLIHWYFSLKEPNIANINKLANFTYDTRISSREFCSALIENQIIIPSEFDLPTSDDPADVFINQIIDSPWFRYGWENDPTISAMLVMIQSIHNKFNGLSDVWRKLTTESLISFEILDLGAKGFELTDELYIKMNARGKQLTSFENFKADFIRFIGINFTDKKLKNPYDQSKEITYSDYFAFKIEKEWTDLFWAFRGDRVVTDDMFMNYISVIAQLCYFKDNLDKKAEDFNNDFLQYQTIFKSESNLLFLFNSLDLLHSIGCDKDAFSLEQFNGYFNSVFLRGAVDEKYDAQVRLFWNDQKYSTLFERCINEGLNMDVRNRIVLYALINYRLKVQQDGNIKHHIRVVRNLIQATRQKTDTKYSMNMRINQFGSYWKLFDQLATQDVYLTLSNGGIDNAKSEISEQALKNENDKAILVKEGFGESIFKLEEFRYFGGLIHRLDPITNKAKLSDYSNCVREIWDNSIDDILIVRSLIASGFEGVEIKWGNMGQMWYFGKTDNWAAILTSNSDIKDPIVKLLDSYLSNKATNSQAKLESIIELWRQSNISDRSWKHYFMTYDAFLSSQYNYFAWNNGYEIRMLSSEKTSPLLATHISPYVKTVCGIINDKSICDEDQCKQQYTGNSPLVLQNGVTLTCTEPGWKIGGSDSIIPPEIFLYFKIDENEKLLKETDDKDRVEIAVEFCRRLYGKFSS